MRKVKVMLVLLVAACLVGCGSSIEPVEEVKEPAVESGEVSEPESTEEEDKESVEVLYADDENINKYLVAYNEANPEYKIEDFEKYSHHGSIHDNQIIFTDGDYDVVISSNVTGLEVSVEGKDTEGYEALFRRYSKGYKVLSEDELGEYWKNLIDDPVHDITFDEFEVRLSVVNDEIEYMVINGGV